jgi:hypothetical protein
MSEYKFSLLYHILVVCINLLVISSIFVAMYAASQQPVENFNIIFFKSIFALLIPILLMGYLLKRLLCSRYKPLP